MNAGSTHISLVSFQARIACQRGSVATTGSAQAKRLIAFVGCGQWAGKRSIPVCDLAIFHSYLRAKRKTTILAVCI
jgi:hypothetical protein